MLGLTTQGGSVARMWAFWRDIAAELGRSSEGRSPMLTIVRGALALLSAQPMTWAAGLLTTMFVPRYLDARAVGEFTIAVTVAGLVGTFVSVGLITSLVRRVAAAPEQSAAHGTAGLVIVLGLSIPVAVGLSIAAPLLGVQVTGDLILPIALAGMVAALPMSVLSAVLVGQERHARFAWVNAVTVTVTAVVSVGVLVAGGSLAAYMSVGMVVTSVAAVLGWRAAGLGFDRSGLRPGYLWHVAREGLPFLAWNVANRIRIDGEVALLAALTRQDVVGWWASAHRVVNAPLFIPATIATPLLPSLSRCRDDRSELNRTLRRSLVLMLALTVPMCALVLALAPTIPRLLGWRAEFENTVGLMMVLSVQLPLVAVGMVLGTALVALSAERSWLVVNVVTTLVCAVLGLIAVPFFDARFQNGAIGLAIVRNVCEVVMIGGALILLPRGAIDGPTIGICARVTLAGCALAAVVMALTAVWIPLAVVAGGAAYAVLLLALRVVRPGDVMAARGIAMEMLARRRGLAAA
jgi:O-antigen/teichoic acid export membrane protein